MGLFGIKNKRKEIRDESYEIEKKEKEPYEKEENEGYWDLG
jgi:hypothetical protein